MNLKRKQHKNYMRILGLIVTICLCIGVCNPTMAAELPASAATEDVSADGVTSDTEDVSADGSTSDADTVISDSAVASEDMSDDTENPDESEFLPDGGLAEFEVEYLPDDFEEELSDDENLDDAVLIDDSESVADTASAVARADWSEYGDTYCYDHMNEAQQSLYDEMYALCETYMNSTINATLYKERYLMYNSKGNGINYAAKDLEFEDAKNVVYIFVYQNPQFYFLSSGLSYNSSYIFPWIYSDFADGETRSEISKAFFNKVDTWVAEVSAQSTQYDKEMETCKIVCDNLTYDYTTGTSKELNQSAYSAVIEGETVCAGYTKLYSILTNAAGLDTVSVTSSSHAWNLTKLGDKWYNVDTTWADTSGNTSGKYYNKSDAQMIEYDGSSRESHERNTYYSGYVPECTENLTVTEATGISASPSSLTLDTYSNQTAGLTVSYTPSSVTDTRTTYTSGNTNVASVNASGTVTAVGAGTTTITVKKTSKSSLKKTCTVMVYGKMDTPSVPTASAQTTTSITLMQQSGCVYSMDGNTWQSDPTFSGLSAGTAYTFYVKRTGSGYYRDSDVSSASLSTAVETSNTGSSTSGGSSGNTGSSTSGSSTGGSTSGSSGGTSNTGSTSSSTGNTSNNTANTGNSTSGNTGSSTSNTGGSTSNTGSGSTTTVTAPSVNVTYRTHVQTYGWQSMVQNGVMSGTSGKAKRLEGIEVSVSGNSALGIQYTTHCQSYGWLPWSANGELNGTEGEAKRLEAIKIQLTGSAANLYDIYYRVHAQSYGWLGWAKNGAPAGTAGLAKRLEAIQIVVVKKGTSAPGLSYANVDASKTTHNDKSYIANSGTSPVVGGGTTSNANPTIGGTSTVNIAYRTHVQTYGWQGWKYNGQMSGTSGQAKRLEGINIKLTNQSYKGDIVYTTHIQSIGWQGSATDQSKWSKNGAMSGTSGQSKRLEAIKIALTGEIAKYYDVYYRVHAQSYGWLAWAKNGEAAGTAGLSKRLEGIQIVLVPKGGAAPSASYGGITSARSAAYISK